MTADFERFDRYIFYIFSLKTAHIGFGHVVSIFLYINIVQANRIDDIKKQNLAMPKTWKVYLS